VRSEEIEPRRVKEEEMVRVREEIYETLYKGGKETIECLFQGFRIGKQERDALLTGVACGHHLLILGPPGCGKTDLASRMGSILGDVAVVEGCPLNCSPSDPSCPWCLEAKSRGDGFRKQILPANERVKRVQGGGELVPEDLIGALDPEAALIYGIHSLTAFAPGKLLRANRGILLVDFIDRMPERVLNTLLYALEGGTATIGAFEEKIFLDILVVATGSQRMLQTLPLGVLEFFDLITLGYMDDRVAEEQLVLNNLKQKEQDGLLSEATIEKAMDIVSRTRTNSEVDRGVSTRGALRFTELLSSLEEVKLGDEEKLLRSGGYCSLPHRLELAPHANVPGKREQIIKEILDEVLEPEARKEAITFSKENLLALVEEITREEKFRKPLKYGAFDLLLKRVQRFSESRLSRMVQEMMSHLEELYPEQYQAAPLTEELLQDIEETRKRDERIVRMRRKLEAEALKETLGYLERQKILEKGTTGWELSRRGVSFLLERLTPNLETSHLYGYGKHSTGKKSSIGEGREVGVRHYRFGDRYRDVSFKDTIREAIRNRREEVTKDDIMVTTKDIRSKIDFVLLVDLSGTMRQLEKLWYAKESAIILSLAAAQYGDRVGVVSFSNMADVIVDITSSPERLTRRVIDLDLHENAFTNIGYGILKAIRLFAHHRGGRASQHMILISDGDATAPSPSPQRYALRQATLAAKKGITISCVCINEESTDPELMRRITRIGKGRIHFVGSEGMTGAVLEERYAASFFSSQ